jgi:hypothetical protein
MIHLLLKAGFAFSFPFADAAGERMTHEGHAFQTRSASVSQKLPAASPLRSSSTASQKHTTPPLCKRSQSDMTFGANVEWLSWGESASFARGAAYGWTGHKSGSILHYNWF